MSLYLSDQFLSWSSFVVCTVIDTSSCLCLVWDQTLTLTRAFTVFDHQGIIFDLDGTLLDYEGASHEVQSSCDCLLIIVSYLSFVSYLSSCLVCVEALERPLKKRGVVELPWDLHATIVGTKPEDWSKVFGLWTLILDP